MPSEPQIYVRLYYDNGQIALMLKDVSIVEQDGELLPGIVLGPISAMELARTLIDVAMQSLVKAASRT